MKIEASKTYKVEKFNCSNDEVQNCGNLSGSDVKELLKGYEYDSMFEMWFSPKAKYGYNVIEA